MYQQIGSINELLLKVQENKYILPAIQREFVWKPDQICQLFDSIMQGYPFGTFLFWNIEKQNIDKYKFYKFMLNYDEKYTQYCDYYENIPQEQHIAVLDGQQRITSLNIGLRGSYTNRFGKETYLYLNVFGQPNTDDNTVYDFKFLTNEEAQKKDKNNYWIKVGEMLNGESKNKSTKYLMQISRELGIYLAKNFHEMSDDEQIKVLDEAESLLSDLNVQINNYTALSAYTEQEQNIEKVLSIFIRMNSGGTPLSYSDLLLSFTVTQWTKLNAREEINELLENIREDSGFKFEKDLILRAGLMLGEVGNLSFKLSNFSKENIVFMEENWDDVKESFLMTTQMLKEFGVDNQLLIHDVAILPIVYYIFRKILVSPDGTKYRISPMDKTAMKNLLLISLLKKGTWTSNLESLLVHIRKAISEDLSVYFVENIKQAMADKDKSLVFNEEDVKSLCDLRYGIDKEIKALLLLVFPDTRLMETHIDHIYPKSIFTPTKMKRLNIQNDSTNKLQVLANTVANLQLIPGSVNVDKKAIQPAVWLNNYFEDESSKRMYMSSQLIDNLSNDLNQFENFCISRREKIETKLRKILEVKELNTSYKKDTVLGGLKLNLAKLSKTQIKFMEKVSVWLNIDSENLNLNFILNELSNHSFTTKVDKEPADTIKYSIITHLYQLLDSFDKARDMKQQAYESGYFKVDEQDSLSTFDLDRYISEDLESFIKYGDPREIEILKKRFGLNQSKPLTLEEIGESLNLTRERVRQIEKKGLIDLRKRMRVSISTIWENLNQNATSQMNQLYPLLAKEFSDIKYFLAFLDLLCDFQKNDLSKVIFPDININDLVEEWCLWNKLPLQMSQVVSLIQDSIGSTAQVAQNAIYHNINSGNLRLELNGEDELIYPNSLSKMPAVVQAALHFNESQNFREIHQKADELKICTSIFPQERQDHAINDAVEKNYLFQSDRGGYSHIKYLPIPKDSYTLISEEVRNILERNSDLNTANLHMQIYELSDVLQQYEYFPVRHIIRNFGEDYGIYFNGKSGADTVSLQAGVKPQGQLQTILNLMESTNKPVTRNSLAKQIRSGSENHASFYLNELMDMGKVVRISAHEYALAQNAFKNINVQELLSEILGILNHYNKPVEVGIIAEKINLKYHLSYPKAWYLHLIKNQSKLLDLKIFTFHNLISLSDIEDQSVHKLISTLDIELTNFEKLYSSVTKHIIVGKTEVRNAVNNLKNSN
ncbi:GmrSD restriction endonuclease domain-containing protein [Acinetobacter sp. MD2]|uniref:GmrSD restriction endonuclease domain-containing protein n=1 Tax=Acinetobacter sp. MD2 TaxID=2600066 RepID=UPI002D1F4B5D|nr:DUF262 domain-containing protein [Acinetobacter sp. MD2]MEB3767092.1 DUF262 domain-containing protein [Acinetobacter sp. MD2]